MTYNPAVGQYFISQYNTVCLRTAVGEYQDLNLKGKAPLAYVPGSSEFSAKRVATNREMIERRYIPLDVQTAVKTREHKETEDNSFVVHMSADHDTSRGLAYLEKEYIQHVFKLAKYNQSKATRMLGISRGTLRSKLKQYFGDKYL